MNPSYPHSKLPHLPHCAAQCTGNAQHPRTRRAFTKWCENRATSQKSLSDFTQHLTNSRTTPSAPPAKRCICNVFSFISSSFFGFFFLLCVSYFLFLFDIFWCVFSLNFRSRCADKTTFPRQLKDGKMARRSSSHKNLFDQLRFLERCVILG